MSSPMTMQDKKWQAEEDARTIKRWVEIKADKKRLAAARKELTAEKAKNEKALKLN